MFFIEKFLDIRYFFLNLYLSILNIQTFSLPNNNK